MNDWNDSYYQHIPMWIIIVGALVVVGILFSGIGALP